MKKNELNTEKVNEVMGLTHKILKIFYILVIMLAAYIILIVAKELNLKHIILSVLKILVPLFIGMIVAWLFNPFVNKLQKKGVKRVFGAGIAYVILIAFIGIILGSLIPLLYDQILDFAESIPGLFDTIEGWLDSFFDKLGSIESIDIETTKNNLLANIEGFSNDLYQSLPSMVVTIVKSLISGIGTFAVGLVIGFFLLLGFENIDETLISYLPKKYRENAKELMGNINGSLRNYVTGEMFDACLIFVVSSLAFWLIGLKAPLLFGVFCGITNVIPYIGPYIGAVPAVIVGFSMSPTIGLLVVLAIMIIQAIEGNFIQALIISRATKLHPVTIISGLLIFGHFWGIVGMLVSTPIIATLKIIFQFIDKKTGFLDFTD